jgi:hypothetical protein
MERPCWAACIRNRALSRSSMSRIVILAIRPPLIIDCILIIAGIGGKPTAPFFAGNQNADEHKLMFLLTFIIRFVRDVGVAGSNPVTPTIDF